MAKFMCTHTIPPGKFTAEQIRHWGDTLSPLGLRLDVASVPMENIVVDHLDRTLAEN